MGRSPHLFLLFADTAHFSSNYNKLFLQCPFRRELQELLGYCVSDNSLQKVASLARTLSALQSNDHDTQLINDKSTGECLDDSSEFGANISFQEPARFLLEIPLENGVHVVDESYATSISNDHESVNHQPTIEKENVNLRWLKNACDQIVMKGGSLLSGDELAMALCRVLESDKAGDEIAGDLLDLVGDGSFETVQDLLLHRKKLVEAIRHGMLILKSEKLTSDAQPRMPSYGTQVTIQTESERQIDKLRRKEEKRYKRGTDHLAENDFHAGNFSSLLQASERKNIFDDLIGSGPGPRAHSVSALPQGTLRKHFKGYEEVRIPQTPTAQMKPGERLIEIKELDDFAQAAFHGYKSLNRIQSRIYQTTYHTNENILVCAPTGAGKTNIAMIAILHEYPVATLGLVKIMLQIKQHFKDGILHKDEFKIVYVAPMKALAAEVTSTFSHRLAPLNLTVRELTGDMQLRKNELEETQMIVTTPEKWDVITRKSSDMSLSMLVKLLIIDEVHLLNDDRGPVIEALVARTLRQLMVKTNILLAVTEPDIILLVDKRLKNISTDDPCMKLQTAVAQFLRVNPEAGLFFFDSSYRPVPLAQQYIGVSESSFAARNNLLNEICYNKVADSLRQGHQAMVFVHSRKDTGKTAKSLCHHAHLTFIRTQTDFKRRYTLKCGQSDLDWVHPPAMKGAMLTLVLDPLVLPNPEPNFGGLGSGEVLSHTVQSFRTLLPMYISLSIPFTEIKLAGAHHVVVLAISFSKAASYTCFQFYSCFVKMSSHLPMSPVAMLEMSQKKEDSELFTNDRHPHYELLKKEVYKSRNKELVELFDSSFGIHHAGMLRADRSLTERLFSEGILKVLVCTATLAWGVNLPAHTVVIKVSAVSVQYYLRIISL
ncbi:hypothetical protein ACLOJK_002466 [Asimina triloba]